MELFELMAPPSDRPSFKLGGRLSRVAVLGVGLAAVLVMAASILLNREKRQPIAQPRPVSPGRVDASLQDGPYVETWSRFLVNRWDTKKKMEMLSYSDLVLHSGERFQILYKSSRNHYLYSVFFNGESKSYSLLYPRPDSIEPVQAGETVLIPNEAQAFLLDASSRTEKLLLIVSAEPVPELEQIRSSPVASERILSLALEKVKGRSTPVAPASVEQLWSVLKAPLGSKPGWVELWMDHR